jgi:hypothetical protein
MAFRALTARSGLLRGLAALSTTTACVDARQSRCVDGFDADRVFHPDEALPVRRLVDAAASPRTERRQIGHILERLGAQADAALRVDPRGYPYSAQAAVLIARDKELERQIDALTRDVTRDEREALPALVAAPLTERPAGAAGIDRSSGALARAADPVQRATAAAAAAQAEAILPSTGDDGLSQYERERLARIARNQAFMQSLGLGGGVVGGGRAARARPNYSESDAAAAERAAERARLREAREGERDAEAELRAQNLALAIADPDDSRVRPDLFGPREKREFAETYCARYEDSEYNGREEYVIQVDVRAKIKCPRRPVTG